MSDNKLIAGQTLNSRYAIVRELKRGGFGIVYLAHDQQLHSRPVVIKVLLEEAFQNEWILQKFRQEVEALSRVDHPGIVGIIDAGELADGKPFIVMQYVDGVVLRAVMPVQGMNFEYAAEIMRQIGRALTAAHDKGIFHRDLKPENIMLQALGHGEEQVKIIDFGIAKIKNSVLAPSTSTGIAAGTVAYMAPEQLSNRAISATTDVYSLAMIAYEMVSGRKPFNPDTAFELLEMQRAGVRIKPIDLRPSLPEAAGDVILQALSFEPRDRPQRARDFTEELARALTGEPGSVPFSQKSTVEFKPAVEPDPVSSENETPHLSAEQASPLKTIRASFGPNPSGAPVAGEGGAGVVELPDYLKSETRVRPRSRAKLVGLLVVLLIAIAGVSAWYVISSRRSTSEVGGVAGPTGTERSVTYSLTVQKMRDNEPYQQPFESSGQEIFENGWKFRMNLSSPEAGFLYLLNEGPAAGGVITYNVLFPEPKTNGGSARVNADQKLQTALMRFDDNQGVEKFWIVWSATAVKELDDVAGVVNPQQQGEISDPAQAKAVRDFLEKHSSPKPEVAKDSAAEKTTVKGKGDVLVSNIELKHH